MNRFIPFLSLVILTTIPNLHSLAEGETCATAVVVGALPYDYSGDTCGSDDDYSIADSERENPNLCLYPDDPFPGQDNYIEGEDFVFEFTPTESSCYNFTLDAGGRAIHLFDTCPNAPLVSCLGYRYNNIGAAVTVNTNLESRNTIYIVISGQVWWCDDFDLTVESPSSLQENDFCVNGIDLQTTGSNDGITIDNVDCTGGGELLQMGLWEDTGDCTLSEDTFIECAIGIGTVVLGPLDNLPPIVMVMGIKKLSSALSSPTIA